MKNIPKTIYLNIGENIEDVKDFGELSEVTWCEDKIYDTDLVYVLQEQPTVSSEVIDGIVQTWIKSNLIEPRSLNAQTKLKISKAIKLYGEGECLQAIERYATVLHSDYYFDYKWNIQKFFTQKNCLPDFLDDGDKWINYREWVKTNQSKKRPLSTISSNAEWDLSSDIEAWIVAHHTARYESFKFSSMSESDEDRERSKYAAFESYLGSIYPVVYAHMAAKHGLYLDILTQNKYNKSKFLTKFDDVLVYEGDKLLFKVNFENEFKKL